MDERNVPLSSDDSNYKAAHAELLRKVRGRWMCTGRYSRQTKGLLDAPRCWLLLWPAAVGMH